MHACTQRTHTRRRTARCLSLSMERERGDSKSFQSQEKVNDHIHVSVPPCLYASVWIWLRGGLELSSSSSKSGMTVQAAVPNSELCASLDGCAQHGSHVVPVAFPPTPKKCYCFLIQQPTLEICFSFLENFGA